ncbi:MAG: hypothetical protein VW307_01845 [Alphaproteobacteria bacterium]
MLKRQFTLRMAATAGRRLAARASWCYAGAIETATSATLLE